MEFEIPMTEYAGSCGLVFEIREIVESGFAHLFHAVIVHGSVATDEIIPYSDFDGLLIVKDQFRNSAELSAFRLRSERTIRLFDPLQHHGWFQIHASDLDSYPQDYFPLELFSAAKMIFPRGETFLRGRVMENPDYGRGFRSLAGGLEKKLATGFLPANAFQLKAYLSQVMLLPAVYLQAVLGKGVLKKNSFEMIRRCFSDGELESIDIASRIRTDWDYSINSLQRHLLVARSRGIRKLVTRLRFPGPAVKEEHRSLLGDGFRSSLGGLVDRMKGCIAEAEKGCNQPGRQTQWNS